MKILFQGDSITDAGRSREDLTDLGSGYPKYASEYIKEAFPDVDFEFINRGVSGDRAESLLARWQEDAVDINPDIISIMIGINDTWHRAAERNWMPNDYFEGCYRNILTQIKEKTHAKIIIIEQYLLYIEDKDYFRIDLDLKIQITRKLAREFADAYIPTDDLFNMEIVRTGNSPRLYSADGVHPIEEGSKFIGKCYLEAAAPIIKELAGK